MLVVLLRRRGTEIDVFKIDDAGNAMERVTSIGSLALFLGARCFVVDARRFPTIEANCAYFQLATVSDEGPVLERRICKIHIDAKDGEQGREFVSETMDMDTAWVCGLPPFTVTQLLSNYTMDIPSRLLRRQYASFYPGGSEEVDCHSKYMDHFVLYVADDEDFEFDPEYHDLSDVTTSFMIL